MRNPAETHTYSFASLYKFRTYKYMYTPIASCDVFTKSLPTFSSYVDVKELNKIFIKPICVKETNIT